MAKTAAHVEQETSLPALLDEVLRKTEALKPYDAGRFAPRDAGELWDLARDWYWSGLLPAAYYPKQGQGNRWDKQWVDQGISKAVIVMRYGASLGVLPEQSVRQIYIVEGQPSPSAALMLSMAFAKGLLKREDWRVVEASKTKVVIELFGSTRGAKVERVVAEYADYKHLHHKDNWKHYAEDMLLARATSRAMRRYFPDVYAGVYATEERVDMKADRLAGLAPDDAAERIMAMVGEQQPDEPPPPLVEPQASGAEVPMVDAGKAEESALVALIEARGSVKDAEWDDIKARAAKLGEPYRGVVLKAWNTKQATLRASTEGGA